MSLMVEMRSLYRHVGAVHSSRNPGNSPRQLACITDKVSCPGIHTKIMAILTLLFLLLQGRLDGLPAKALYRFTLDPEQRGTATTQAPELSQAP